MLRYILKSWRVINSNIDIKTGNLIDMTGGNGGTPELFAVTFIDREKKQ